MFHETLTAYIKTYHIYGTFNVKEENLRYYYNKGDTDHEEI